MSDVSLFPPREILLICRCGNERQVPQRELAKIRSVGDFNKFTKGRLGLYACRCGASHCDIRMLPSEEGSAELRRRDDEKNGGGGA